MSDSAQDHRVDELRRQLRALGYLDAGVDRFVLAGARSARRPWSIALLASVRIGSLAALLLGPAAAAGLAGRLPGLVTGPADAIVIAVYLGVLFGAAATALALAASLVGAWAARRSRDGIPRRARLVAATAGTLVTIACLLYLTLWWRTAHAGFGWAAPVWTAFALLVAVVISLLIGHAVIVTTLAVAVAETGDAPDLPRVPGASLRVSAAAAVLAFLGAAGLLVVTVPAPERPGAPLTVVPSGLRLRVVAIDGFDPATFGELSAAGQVPALTAALDGARASVEFGDTADPARTWTTLATGVPAERHGVHGLETRRVTGVRGIVPDTAIARTVRDATDLLRLTRPGVVTGVERRARTFWEVAAGAGLDTAIVNWWTTWPAVEGAGLVLSDRATLRLERGGDLDAEIAPPELYDRLRAAWPRLRDEAAALADTRFGAAIPDGGVDAVLSRSAELDAMQVVLARELAAGGVDLAAVYLPGLDIAQHALLGGGAIALGASAVAVRIDALKRYYLYLDRLLGPELPPREGELALVVTGPGRVGAAASGLIGLRGVAAASGSAGVVRVTDVAPTILYLLGIPVSEELAGSPVSGLLRAEFLDRHPVRTVASYGRPAQRRVPGGEPLDQEMIERLRSLGYVR